MAHDVFISYSSKDKTTADAVCARLEARGIRCWIAPRDVRYGANYGAAIIDAIHASRVMVLVLSSHANESRHIPNEIERAVSHGLAIVPFRIEEVAPAKSLDLFIGSRHWLDAWTPPLEAHLDRLAESLDGLISEERAPVPEPAPPRPPPVPPPLPRPTISPLVAAGAVAVVVVVALLAWLAFGRSGGTAGVPTAGAAVAPPTVPSAATGAATDIVGCWRWGNNATVVIRSDGSMTAAPFNGTWQLVGNRSYAFTWPEPVDTLTMSPDRRTMAGANQYGVPVLATRVSGGPDVSGVWSWGGVATVTVDHAGSVALGTLKGRWTGDANQAHIRVTWEKIRDSVTLSDDASHIQGGNQYGAPVSGVRLASCP